MLARGLRVIGFLGLSLALWGCGDRDQMAGEEQNDIKVNLNSPQSTVENLFIFLQDERHAPELAAKSIYAPDLTAKDRRRIAKRIKQILDGKGIFLDTEAFPTSNNYLDSVTGREKWVLVPDDPQLRMIYVEKIDGKWYFPPRTAEAVPGILREVYPFGTHKLLDWTSEMGHEKYMGLYGWQLIGLLILVLASFIIHKVLSFVMDRILVAVLKRMGYGKFGHKYILPVVRPLSLIVITLLLSLFVPVLQLPIKVAEYIILILRGLTPLLLTVAVFRFVNIVGMYMMRLAEKSASTLDDQLVPLVRKALKAFVIIIGGLFVLQNLNFNITTLLAGLSIGGLAFALAAQDSIKNFFGSLMIFVDKPFQIGDWIISDGLIDGDVMEVGFRTTRIRTFYNSVITVPNGQLADMTVDNYGKREFRRYKTFLAVTYDTPPEKIDAFVAGLRKIVDLHPDTRKDVYHIYLNTFGAASLDILFYMFFKVPTWADELRARHEINLEIIALAESLEVRFAFPTQTLHIEDFPEKKGLTPAHDKGGNELQKLVEARYAKGQIPPVGPPA